MEPWAGGSPRARGRRPKADGEGPPGPAGGAFFTVFNLFSISWVFARLRGAPSYSVSSVSRRGLVRFEGEGSGGSFPGTTFGPSLRAGPPASPTLPKTGVGAGSNGEVAIKSWFATDGP